jgi:hypothetical protein
MAFLPRRPVRAAAFALLAAGGIAALAWPPPAVQAATSPAAALAFVWAAMLILGGVCSAAGAITDRWLGEYVGLWPLITVFAIYGVSAFASSRGLVAVAGGCVLTAVAGLLLARWQDVALIRREAGHGARNGNR